MTQIQVSFDDQTLRNVLLGDKGAEVLLEKVMNEILQAEMTEHLGFDPTYSRPIAGQPGLDALLDAGAPVFSEIVYIDLRGHGRSGARWIGAAPASGFIRPRADGSTRRPP